MQKRRKKIVVSLSLLSSFLFSCSGSYEASPEMKSFFDTISAASAYSFITSAKVQTIYKTYDGNGDLAGTITGGYEFSKGESYYLHKKYSYTGSEITDGVTSYEYIGKIDSADGAYYEWTKNNDDSSSISKKSTLEGNLETAIRESVYISTGTYNTGGLYYGDIFMVNSNSFPNDAFVISEDKKTMSFVYKYAKAFTNSSNQNDYVQIDENTTINSLGLVLTSFEEVSFANSKELGHNEETVRYNEEVEVLSF